MSPCDRYSVFIDGIFHHRHENWLHSLIARILLHRLHVPNVLDKPEAFFVKNQQKKIMKSNHILQKTVLNTHRVVRLGYFLHRWVYVRDTTHFDEVFLKNDTTDIEEFYQNDICYFGDFWILISIWISEQKRVRPDIFFAFISLINMPWVMLNSIVVKQLKDCKTYSDRCFRQFELYNPLPLC